MTRQQMNLAHAFDNVSTLIGTDTAKTYGSLCHSFPILIRTNGLCQTLAFYYEKKSGDDTRARAYGHIWNHIAATIPVDPQALLNRVQTESVSQYLLDSQRLIEAWVYYKRFAVSLLGVNAGEEDAG